MPACGIGECRVRGAAWVKERGRRTVRYQLATPLCRIFFTLMRLETFGSGRFDFGERRLRCPLIG